MLGMRDDALDRPSDQLAVELRDLEAQLGVELPSEYRSFLVETSAGGAGPAYGLSPVRRKDEHWSWEGDGSVLTELATLHQPFPHTEAFNPADGLPSPPAEADYDSQRPTKRPRMPTGRCARRRHRPPAPDSTADSI